MTVHSNSLSPQRYMSSTLTITRFLWGRKDVDIEPPELKLKKLTLAIQGMHCKGCASTIENSLKRLKGVVKAKVEFKGGRAWLVYDPDAIAVEQIVQSAVFMNSHFTAQLVES